MGIRRGEPHGRAHGAAESSNTPVLRFDAEVFSPSTEADGVAGPMIGAEIFCDLALLHVAER